MAPAIDGSFSPADALRRLSAGSGLSVTVNGTSAVVTQASGITVPTVQVTAAPDGSAAAGYLTKRATTAGPIWGDRSAQDTPYSTSVVSSALINNLQAYQPEQIVKVIPQITNVLNQQNSSGNPFFYIRGFSVTQFTNGSGISYDGLLGGAGGMFDTVLAGCGSTSERVPE